MKIGKRTNGRVSSTNPSKNNSKKNIMIVGVLVVTVLLIIWVYAMGKKAEDTVSVVMWSEPVYKNQPISMDIMQEYKMLSGEFEKYAISDGDGKQRRIILWEEAEQLVGTFAAYPLQQNTIAMITDVITSRIDNKDTVLYSFPGKEIVSLESVGTDSLEAFKTFLQPGDRINITAVFKDTEQLNDGSDSIETYREETLFKDIIVADLINGQGESILDIYASYNDATTYEQAQMDASELFQESVTPSQLLVALTPEEITSYYKYISRSNVEFKISLPQRMN